MKSSTTAAAIFAIAAPALAAQGDDRWLPIEAFNTATGESLGYLWSEPIEAQYPNPVYGDESFDLMFATAYQNLKRVQIFDEPEGSTAGMSCARTGPSPCWGYGYFDVGGGEWEAGHYMVRAGFRYSNTPGYSPDSGFKVGNYNNDTGAVDFEYVGLKRPYAFYGRFSPLGTFGLLLVKFCFARLLTAIWELACGSLPATANDEPNGDLYIKYASEPTPPECQDIRLQMRFEAGTGSINWKKADDCVVFNHGMC
jgi:hypothetical protein